MSLQLIHDVGRAISVRAADVELVRYIYQPDTVQLESPKPYLHPVRTRAGRLVSLFRPHDHVWHKGIAWSLPHVGDENFWGGPTYVHGSFYVQLENNGRMQHVRTTEATIDDERVTFRHDLEWITQRGSRMIAEERSLSVELADPGWLLVFTSRMHNVSGQSIAFGSPTTKGRENAGYGGLFWRGPRSFTGGRVLTADGEAGDDARGTHAEWMGFCGQHDDTADFSTIVVVDASTNPHHPPQWFTRTLEFACLNPAPFFSEELVVQPEQTVSFSYAVAVADGAGAELAPRLAELGRTALDAHRLASFAAGPQ